MRLFADLRYAFRTLAKSPGFAGIAILSLALGIGANSAMFSYVDAMLLRPLPVPDSGQIVQVDSTAPGTRLGRISYPDYLDLRERSETFSSLVCYQLFMAGVATTRDEVPRVNLAVIASENFFSGLGIPIPLGRGFLPDEDTVPGRDLVAVISHSLWTREFASDPNAIGRKLRLNGAEFTIIGVATPDFTGPEAFVLPEVYVPTQAFAEAVPDSKTELTSRGSRGFTVIGRMKPGVGAQQAQAQLSTVARRIAAQYPDTNRDRSVTVLDFRRARFENDPIDATLSLTMMGVAALVLMIACANVANLVLARGSARAKEIAIRMAIGAGRGRLIRQLLTESLLLSILGGIAGLAVGYAGVHFLGSIEIPSDFPLSFGLRMDARLLTFSMTLAVVTGVIFGLLPALRSTRADLASTIKSSDQGPARISLWRGRMSARNFLVVAQLTLSVVLLIASAFFVRGFVTAQRIDPGFRLDHTLALTFDPSLMRYDETKARLFYKNLKDRVREMNGVSSVAITASIPFSTNQDIRRVIIDGYQPRAGEDAPRAMSARVDENYFPLMETPILRGRSFDTRDTATSPLVAIVNETLASRSWPNRDPIGQRLRLDGPKGPVVEVVGVAKTGKYMYWAEPPQAYVWTPFAQDYRAQMTLVVRTTADPASMAAAMRATTRALDPDMPSFDVRTLESFFEKRAMLGPRLIAQMVTAIGMMGLLLAVVGLYAVVAYAVNRRTREIGIRMAIGARPGDVLRMVLNQGLGFTVAGLAMGIALAFFAMRFLVGFAVGVQPHDPIVFIGVPLILAAVMMAACWIPARRAARVDPVLTLRQE
jgi:macrolide transport system ATP-binding/permease protein